MRAAKVLVWCSLCACAEQPEALPSVSNQAAFFCGTRDAPATRDKWAHFPERVPFTDTDITWRVERYTGDLDARTVDGILAAAFAPWSTASTLDFRQVAPTQPADIRIRFDHPGEELPEFDKLDDDTLGIGDSALHTVLFNDDVDWSQPTHDLQSVALHELGHVLGLAHSDEGNAVMTTSLRDNSEKRALHREDELAINVLYGDWQPLRGLATDVAASGSRGNPVLWVTSGANTVWRFDFVTERFMQVPGDGVAISVGNTGLPWVVSSDDSLWEAVTPDGVWWPRGSAKDVAVGSLNGGGTAIWILSTRSTGDGNYVLQKLQGDAFVDSDESGVRVAVDPLGRVYVVKRDGAIWRRGRRDNNVSGGWESLPGCASDIGVGTDGDIWVVDCRLDANGNGPVWVWNEQSVTAMVSDPPFRRGFVPVAAAAKRIAGGPDGKPFAVDAQGGVWRRVAR
ncbi:MAG: matrixin family metalloprotease [Polyangiales bacterium]